MVSVAYLLRNVGLKSIIENVYILHEKASDLI